VYETLAMMVPAELGIMDAEQLDVVALTVASVHGVPVKDPVAVPVLVKATVPPGADVVPVEVSLTNAVQFTVCPTATELGEQEAVDEVERRLTVTVLLVPLLPL
jgi:hypothetical protein